MEGVWESQIRSIRSVLAGLTREQTLTSDMLATLMCIAEGIVNNCPITMVSDDHRDFEPLRPSHLLLLRPTAALRGTFSGNDQYSRKKWKQVQYLADVFWRRWTREYLPSLRQRTQWLSAHRDLTAGDIIIVVDPLAPRNEWPLGRVTEIKPGQDGRVWTVKVFTKGHDVMRPITKLCLLEEAE